MSFTESLGNWLDQSGIIQNWQGWNHFHFEEILQLAVAGTLIFFAIRISRLLRKQTQTENAQQKDR